MADYFYGKVMLPAKFVQGEVKRLIEEYIDSENDGDDKVAEFSDNQARYGAFDGLEAELKDRGIPFDRYSAAAYDYGSTMRRYRPATKNHPEIDVEIPVDSCGQPYVATRRLRPLLELTPEEALQRLADLVEEADPNVDPLEDWEE